MLRNRTIAYFTALSLGFSGALSAKVSPEEAARLGEDLTPLGAIQAGNEEGTIPAWEGGLTQPPSGYSEGTHHMDPFPDDKPLFTITAENFDEYKDFLTPGQIRMFERYPNTWRLPIYETRRTAAFPEYVYEAVKANALTAELNPSGNGVVSASVGPAFPIPQEGLHAIWNHLLRYRAEKVRRTIVQAAPTSSGSYTLVKIKEDIYLPYAKEGTSVADLGNRIFFFMQEVTEPAFLAGQILLVHETLDQYKEPREAWVYNPGQRRVRRAPNIAFDNPGTASDGQRTTDQFDMFNGSPERYDWKLIGRKELYVPYNSYALHSGGVDYNQILKTGHMNQDLTRYEKHRVWEVEATVKPGTSHIYAKRVFYIDEDSWQILLVDQYDSRGNIWRISEAHCINYYQIPSFWDTVIAHYDVLNGRYLVIGLSNKEAADDFNIDLERGDFTPSQLRKRGRR